MAGRSGEVRPERSRGRRRRDTTQVVVVTGADTPLGSKASRHLDGAYEVREVALERDDEELVKALAGADAVVHLGLDVRPDAPASSRTSTNVAGTAELLAAAGNASVARVVLLSSAMVYGALPDNPVPLQDDSPLRAVSDDGLLGDLVAIERLVAAHSGRPDVTVLRPAVLVGPDVDSVFTRYFESPRLLVVGGTRPRWQFCHVEDLLSAVEVALEGRVTGVATVASPGWLEQDDLERITGRRSLTLPAAVALATAERLHRTGVIRAQPSEIAFHMHPWVVSPARLEAAGWSAAYDNERALSEHLRLSSGHLALGARRVDRDSAGRAAAGAGTAVALVGAAALVRSARRRRRG